MCLCLEKTQKHFDLNTFHLLSVQNDSYFPFMAWFFLRMRPHRAFTRVQAFTRVNSLRLIVNSPRYNFHTSCRKQNGRHHIPTAKRYTNKACKKINNKQAKKQKQKLWTNRQYKTNTNINTRPAYTSLLLPSLSHDNKIPSCSSRYLYSFKTVVVTGLNFKPWMSFKNKKTTKGRLNDKMSSRWH